MGDKQKYTLPKVTINDRSLTMNNSTHPISPAEAPPPYPDVVSNHLTSPQDAIDSSPSRTKKDSIVAFNEASVTSKCYVNENYVDSPDIGKAIAMDKLGGEIYD